MEHDYHSVHKSPPLVPVLSHMNPSCSFFVLVFQAVYFLHILTSEPCILIYPALATFVADLIIFGFISQIVCGVECESWKPSLWIVYHHHHLVTLSPWWHYCPQHPFVDHSYTHKSLSYSATTTRAVNFDTKFIYYQVNILGSAWRWPCVERFLYPVPWIQIHCFQRLERSHRSTLHTG